MQEGHALNINDRAVISFQEGTGLKAKIENMVVPPRRSQNGGEREALPIGDPRVLAGSNNVHLEECLVQGGRPSNLGKPQSDLHTAPPRRVDARKSTNMRGFIQPQPAAELSRTLSVAGRRLGSYCGPAAAWFSEQYCRGDSNASMSDSPRMSQMRRVKDRQPTSHNNFVRAPLPLLPTVSPPTQK